MSSSYARPLLISLALMASLSGCDRVQQVRDYFSKPQGNAPLVQPGQGNQIGMLLPDFPLSQGLQQTVEWLSAYTNLYKTDKYII